MNKLCFFPTIFGPLIEVQIPLLPHERSVRSRWSKRSKTDRPISTCQTWKDASKEIREVSGKLTTDINLVKSTRIHEVDVLPNGRKHSHDEYDHTLDMERVVVACPANAVGNICKRYNWMANAILPTFVYADGHHPNSRYMHSVLCSDGTIIEDQH